MLFIKGKVTRKFVENGRHLVEIEQEAHNQDDELSDRCGTGIVEAADRRGVRPWRMTAQGGTLAASGSSTCRACWPVRSARRCWPTTART